MHINRPVTTRWHYMSIDSNHRQLGSLFKSLIRPQPRINRRSTALVLCEGNLLHIRLPWWRHQIETFPRNWPFVLEIHRSPVNSPHKGKWRWALMFSLICTWIYRWLNDLEADDLGRYRVHYDVIVMVVNFLYTFNIPFYGRLWNSKYYYT